MKERAPGKASWIRISQESTSATMPIEMAVTEYCTAMIFASWLNTYFVHQLCG